MSEENKKVSISSSALPIYVVKKHNAVFLFIRFQGLNVVKSVIDLKGVKRFKREDGEQTAQQNNSPTDFNVKIKDANHAREIMRKM